MSRTGSNGENSNENDRAPRFSDCPTGSVTPSQSITNKGRPKRPPLFRFYRNLQRKSVVDPLALLALIVALVPLAVSFFWSIIPAKSSISTIEFFTLRTESYPLPDNSKATVLRLTAGFEFENTHPKKRSVVQKISASLNIGSHQSNLAWSQFINSYEDPDQPKTLKFTHLATAGKFSVPISDVIVKEVYFAPLPGTKSQPLKNAIQMIDFEKSIANGNAPCVAFSFHEEGRVQRMFYQPKNATSLPKYIKQKGWVVSEWNKVSSCS